jgi:ribosomal protein S12 methylthiotransferase accessory factor
LRYPTYAAVPFDEIPCLRAPDLLTEHWWLLDRLREAGFARALMADYSVPAIAPARAVRVLVPGLEATTNCVHTGPRVRARMIADLLE